ncbi:MAG: Gfo/Idh/MocA family oxidoreductase [Proteobacteria bacterium]|nr:Gfo/Idh/MocA family oxidoreductase [Pseudomonadota bacterium]
MINIAIVGCGDIARFTAFAGRINRKIRLAACVDVDPDKAASFAKRFRIAEFYTEYETMLERSEIDVVYLAVPHHLHYPMIMTALDRGRHVFCEKPITIELDDALEICRFAGKQKRKVGVNYQYRYDKGCYALAQAANRGDLGDLYYARCNVPWHRKSTYFTQAKWHASLEQSGGGTLLTQASHLVDIGLWALGGRPARAQGTARRTVFKEVEVEDLYLGTIEMENGRLLQIASSMVAKPEQPLGMEVYGSQGTGIYSCSFFPKVFFRGVKVKKAVPPVKGLHALFASLEGFRRWIADDMPYLMPVEQSLPVLAAIQALYRSSKTGNSEPVDDRFLEFIGK